jgi:hypothetical protein
VSLTFWWHCYARDAQARAGVRQYGVTSSSFITAHNPSSVTEIRENANAPIKRELRRAIEGSHQREHPCFKRSRIAVEMLQNAHEI